MNAIAYMLDRSKCSEGVHILLPEAFLQRFVATAKKNKSFRLNRHEQHQDVMMIAGTDQRGRDLIGFWSTDPAHAIEGKNVVMFRDTAEDLQVDVS